MRYLGRRLTASHETLLWGHVGGRKRRYFFDYQHMKNGEFPEDGLRRPGSQMRTAPLWGVRTRTALLHDGRAATIDAAIRAHDGQGRLARDLFLGLGSRARVALLAFVNSL